MAFDLSTARKVEPQGFDIRTAKSADRMIPRSPPETRSRAEVEAELRQREGEADATQRKLDVLGPIGEGVRAVGSTLTNLAKGAVGIPSMVENALVTLGEARGAPLATPGSLDMPRPLGTLNNVLSPPELAPRNGAEEFIGRVEQGVGGAGGVTGTARAVAERTAAPLARAVATALEEMPARQAVATVTSAAAGQGAHEMGAGPGLDFAASLVGGAAPFVGAGGGVPRPSTAERLVGTPSGDLRAAGFKTTARQAEGDLALANRGDPSIERVPGSITTRLAHPTEVQAHAQSFNANRANELAGQDIGLSGRALVPAELERAAAPHVAVYDELARTVPRVSPDGQLVADVDSLGANLRDNPLLRNNPEIEQLRDQLYGAVTNGTPLGTQDILNSLKLWRKRASVLFQSADDPAKLEMAQTYRNVSRAFEDALERQAAVDPELVQRFRDARTQLAKIHNVEDALVAGSVDPQALARMAGNYPLSGNLQVIADLAARAPELMKAPTNITFPMRDENSFIASMLYPIRSRIGEQLIPRLLSEDFQGQHYGAPQPGFANRVVPGPGFLPPPAPVPGGIVRGQPLDFQQAPNTRPVQRYPEAGVQFEPQGNVSPPQPGRDTLTATPLADSFDALPPAEARPGDLTANVPPAPGGAAFSPSDLGIPDSLVSVLGLEVPPSRFTGGLDTIPFDQGLDFPLGQVDPAPIVRGGPAPGTVQDTLLTDELLGRPAGQQGVPLDAQTGANIGTPGGPATRPAAGPGAEFGTGFGEPPANPLLRGPEPPLEGEFIPGNGGGPRAPRDPYADAVDAELADFLRLGGPPPEAPAAAALPAPPKSPPVAGGAEAPTPIDVEWLPGDRPRSNAPREGQTYDQEGNQAVGEQPDLAEMLGLTDSPAPRTVGGDELTLADEPPPPSDIRGRYRDREFPANGHVIEHPSKNGYIQYEKSPDGKTWEIRSTFTRSGARKQGIGTDNMIRLATEARDAGATLNSDRNISSDQAGVYKRAFAEGRLTADGDVQATMKRLEASFDSAGNALNEDGAPWFTNIRLGPAS